MMRVGNIHSWMGHFKQLCLLLLVFPQQSCKRQKCDIELSETSVQVCWQRALLLMQASGLSRNGWFHCWAVFTLLLQGKGFLEGTTLPPIRIYLGPAGLSKKRESTYLKDWKKHCHHMTIRPSPRTLVLSLPCTGMRVYPAVTLFDPQNNLVMQVLLFSFYKGGNQGSQRGRVLQFSRRTSI